MESRKRNRVGKGDGTRVDRRVIIIMEDNEGERRREVVDWGRSDIRERQRRRICKVFFHIFL
jgi:hypothetical protein